MWQKRTLFLESLGCAKNQVDAELMLSRLSEAGWTVVEDAEQAEVVLVNTCGFIASAKEEAIQVCLQFANAGKKVVMGGCLSQRYGAEIAPDMPEIAGFFGNRSVESIVDYLENQLPQNVRVFRPFSVAPAVLDKKSVQVVDKDLPAYSCGRRSHIMGFSGTAYVKIAEGCRNRCTFCAIPLIRGDLRSRSTQEVLAEVQDLLQRGIKEIILIAQDLNAFGKDRKAGNAADKGRSELVNLVQEILTIPGDYWVRPLYVYPDTFDFGLLELCRQDRRLLPYFDIPFQHGSAAILKAMGRPGNKQSYVELIGRIRDMVPEAAIRTSILVGFPGESEEDFAELLDFQQQASLEWLGVFTYSAEEGTHAARIKPVVNKKLALQRQGEIESRQIALTAKRLKRYIGMELDILIEEVVNDEDMALGRSFFQAPEVDGLTVVHGPRDKLLPGQFVKVRLFKLNGVDMEGEMIDGR